jgi:hypothetical protein
MKKSIHFKIIFCALMMLSLAVRSQSDKPIIMQAMYDEQQRSIKELKMDGHEAPFYISYDITDLKTYYFSATSGALLQSGYRPIRSKNMRILVGGYEFNDESIDNDIFTAPQPNEIAVPLEDDYAGIRRSLWVTTDAIYRSAAQHFKENQNTLKEKGKELKDLPHRTFAKVTPQQVNQYKNFPVVDKTQYENYVRKLSEYFRSVPEIYTSTVSLNIIQGNRYYLNTEGTSAITPQSNIILQIRAAKDHKMMSNKEKVLYYSSLEKLPSVDQLKDELKTFVATVIDKNEEMRVEEEYTGPVLFMGPSVSEVMAALLFGRETLMANNNLELDTRARFENTTSLENRIGKVIVNESMTVKAKPKLKTFDGLELMGAFDIDDEGVTPPDELVLIEKGFLKALLNDRSLTKPDQTANGHANGPGVIEVKFEGAQTAASLKQMLLSKAKEEGFSYAYIIKKISMREMGESEMYRVDVATGKEELVSDGRPSSLQLKNLRKAKASSDKLKAYNFPMNGNNMVSFICPEALLLEDIEIMPVRIKEPDDETTVFVEMPK